MMANVITINLANNAVHDERLVNLKNPAGQRWLINHMNWAMNNKHGIQMHNQQDKLP